MRHERHAGKRQPGRRGRWHVRPRVPCVPSLKIKIRDFSGHTPYVAAKVSRQRPVVEPPHSPWLASRHTHTRSRETEETNRQPASNVRQLICTQSTPRDRVPYFASPALSSAGCRLCAARRRRLSLLYACLYACLYHALGPRPRSTRMLSTLRTPPHTKRPWSLWTLNGPSPLGALA